MVKERNLVLCIVLSLITFGIYSLIWICTVNDDTNEVTGTNDLGGVMVIILTIVTFGIYGFYWYYKLGEKLDFCRERNGENSGNFALIFLVLAVVGLGLVNMCIAQNELNQHANC